MNQISGMGGPTPSSTRWRKVSLSKKGQRALSVLRPDSNGSLMAEAHMETEALRRFADMFRRKRGLPKESVARFEMDQETGGVSLVIYDPATGEAEVTLTPEQVAEGLKTLEETDDNAAPLASFFIDTKA